MVQADGGANRYCRNFAVTRAESWSIVLPSKVFMGLIFVWISQRFLIGQDERFAEVDQPIRHQRQNSGRESFPQAEFVRSVCSLFSRVPIFCILRFPDLLTPCFAVLLGKRTPQRSILQYHRINDLLSVHPSQNDSPIQSQRSGQPPLFTFSSQCCLMVRDI